MAPQRTDPDSDEANRFRCQVDSRKQVVGDRIPQFIGGVRRSRHRVCSCHRSEVTVPNLDLYCSSEDFESAEAVGDLLSQRKQGGSQHAGIVDVDWKGRFVRNRLRIAIRDDSAVIMAMSQVVQVTR